MTVLLKWIYIVNIISIKITSGFFSETDKLILKFAGKFESQDNQKNLKTEEQNWRPHSLDFRSSANYRDQEFFILALG